MVNSGTENTAGVGFPPVEDYLNKLGDIQCWLFLGCAWKVNQCSCLINSGNEGIKVFRQMQDQQLQ